MGVVHGAGDATPHNDLPKIEHLAKSHSYLILLQSLRSLRLCESSFFSLPRSGFKPETIQWVEAGASIADVIPR